MKVKATVQLDLTVSKYADGREIDLIIQKLNKLIKGGVHQPKLMLLSYKREEDESTT